MSSIVSRRSEARIPVWLLGLLGLEREPGEGESISVNGLPFVMREGILRSCELPTAAQGQTSDIFGYKWHRRETFESDAWLGHLRDWLVARYGGFKWLDEFADSPILLDAGCGAAASAIELFGPMLNRVRYIGADISRAVDVARQRYLERAIEAGFIQTDLCRLPFAPGSIDIIFSEGVLHHTDSTEKALKSLAPLLRHGGKFLFYVYRRKGPIREFTDDFIRERIQGLSPQAAWQALVPLSRFGKLLGEMKIEIDVPEPIDLLEIPAGKIDLQRFFYWHVFKAFYHPEFSIDEMIHVNFDWYAPQNAHRQSPEAVRQWCADAGLEIERERVEEAGITIIARKIR